MNVSFRQLRAFCAVAQLGSFVDAARVMHLTPPALSIMVRELEETLGFKLFDRSTRKVMLSEAGKAYLEHAERVLNDLRTADLAAQKIRLHRSGVVRIAMTPLMTLSLLPPVFAAFHRQWPQVLVDPVDVQTDQILSCVTDGRADLAISFRSPLEAGLEALPLFSSQVHAVFHPTHPLADATSLKWADLADEPIIFIGRGAELRVRAELPSDIALLSRHETHNAITAFALVAGGAGVAVGPGYVKALSAVHDLRVLPILAPVVERQFMLYRPRQRSASPAVAAYTEFLMNFYAPMKGRPIEVA